jgi:poly(3-hydroxybutyrate) depolymerase
LVPGNPTSPPIPASATALVDQFLHFNGHPSAGFAGSLPPSHASSHEAGGTHYPTHTDDWTRNGRVDVRCVRIQGLGHAWSGGDRGYAYADPHGPDALDLFARFIADAG